MIKLGYPAPGIAELVIDRPEARNALSFAHQFEFARLVAEVATDSRQRVLIIRGTEQSFLSGGDLDELIANPGRSDGLRLSTIMGDALLMLAEGALTTIAEVNGYARGGGAEVAVAMDFRIMAAETDIAFLHSRLGLIPGWGGMNRLENLVGKDTARSLLLSGETISAERALELGLVNKVAPREALHDEALKLAVELADIDQERFASRRTLANRLQNRKVVLEERAAFLRKWDRPARREKFAATLRAKSASRN